MPENDKTSSIRVEAVNSDDIEKAVINKTRILVDILWGNLTGKSEKSKEDKKK